MSVLYSVTFQKKSFVTRYDTKGRVIEKKDTLIEQTIRDLPFATAMGYVQGMGASMMAQRIEGEPIKFDPIDPRKKGMKKGELKVFAAGGKPKKSKHKIKETADYKDLVNILMEKGE